MTGTESTPGAHPRPAPEARPTPRHRTSPRRAAVGQVAAHAASGGYRWTRHPHPTQADLSRSPLARRGPVRVGPQAASPPGRPARSLAAVAATSAESSTGRRRDRRTLGLRFTGGWEGRAAPSRSLSAASTSAKSKRSTDPIRTAGIMPASRCRTIVRLLTPSANASSPRLSSDSVRISDMTCQPAPARAGSVGV